MVLYYVTLDCKEDGEKFFWSCEVLAFSKTEILPLLDDSSILKNIDYVIDEIEIKRHKLRNKQPEIVSFSGKAFYK